MSAEKPTNWAARWILVASVFAVFGRTLGFDFVTWDDGLHVYENPGLSPITWGHWLGFWTGPFKGLYIPVTYSAWSLVTWVSPGGAQWAAPFHVLNLLFHCLNALVVFEILGLLGIAALPALLGAALFALHPLQVESVAWVTGFKEIFFGSFSLAALWVLLKKREGASWKGIAFGLSVAAALCKPTGVVLPLLFASIEFSFYKVRLKELARVFVPWTLALLPIAVVAVFAQEPKHAGPSLLQRLGVAGDSFTFYLSKLVFPYPLLPQYDHSLEKILSSNTHLTIGLSALAIFAFVSIVAVRGGKRLAAGAGAFLIPLLPVSGLVPFWYQDLSTVADHYAYLSMFGVSLLLALLLSGERKKVLTGLTATGIVILGVWSSERSLIWKNGKALAEYTLRYNPESAPAHLDLGLAYRDEKRMDLAIEEFKEAIRFQDGYGDAYVDLGCAYATVERYREAVEAFTKAVEMSPLSGSNQFNLAKAMTLGGHIEAAGSHFQEAIRLSPEIEFDVQLFVGDALEKRGYLAASKLHYQAALRVRPDSQLVSRKLGELRL